MIQELLRLLKIDPKQASIGFLVSIGIAVLYFCFARSAVMSLFTQLNELALTSLSALFFILIAGTVFFVWHLDNRTATDRTVQFRKQLPFLIVTTLLAHAGIPAYMLLTLSSNLAPTHILLFILLLPLLVAGCFALGFGCSTLLFKIKGT